MERGQCPFPEKNELGALKWHILVHSGAYYNLKSPAMAQSIKHVLQMYITFSKNRPSNSQFDQ